MYKLWGKQMFLKKKKEEYKCIDGEDENGKPNIPVYYGYGYIGSKVYHMINGKLKKCKACTKENK